MPSRIPTSAESMLVHERSLLDHGILRVAGVDEVGRGALAGPLAAAAVVLPTVEAILADSFWSRVRDSKVVPEAERTVLAAGIRARAAAVTVALIPPEIIDMVGVGPANRMAMESAICQLDPAPDLILLDAFVTDLGIPQVSLVKGDGHCLSIAAASIVAKVARDEIMRDYDRNFADFGFGTHKGYGVASHLEALQRHGPSPIHRFCFAPVAAARELLHDDR
jgi:ribonuclease HII